VDDDDDDAISILTKAARTSAGNDVQASTTEDDNVAPTGESVVIVDVFSLSGKKDRRHETRAKVRKKGTTEEVKSKTNKHKRT